MCINEKTQRHKKFIAIKTLENKALSLQKNECFFVPLNLF